MNLRDQIRSSLMRKGMNDCWVHDLKNNDILIIISHTISVLSHYLDRRSQLFGVALCFVTEGTFYCIFPVLV